MLINLLIASQLIIFLFFFLFYLARSIDKRLIEVLNNKRKEKSIINFKTYFEVFEFLCDRCFSIIYKNKVMLYSLEGYKLKDSEVDSLTLEFISLFMRYVGHNIKEEFVFLFGDEKTLMFVLVEYFHQRLENDLIFEKTMQTSFEHQGEVTKK